MMRLGLTSAAFYGRLETEDAAERLGCYPLDTCEVFLETGSEYHREFGELVKSRLNGLPCRAIHAKGTQFEGDLFGSSQRQRDDAFHTLEGVLDCGKALGAAVYVFHGQPDHRGSLSPLRIPRLTETAAAIIAMAQARGIQFAWENVSWCALKTPMDASFLKKACPGLRFVLDIKQAYQKGVDPFDFLPVLGDSLVHVHVLDYDAEGHLCLPGKGVFDFCRLWRDLNNMGYQGDVILEPYAFMTEDDQALRESIAYLRDIFS